MATQKINCPKCLGTGLTGNSNLVICTECSGVGTIQVDDTQSIATISAASEVPVFVSESVTVNDGQLEELAQDLSN